MAKKDMNVTLTYEELIELTRKMLAHYVEGECTESHFEKWLDIELASIIF